MTKIFITKFDYDRLTKLIGKKKTLDDFDRALLAELKKGKIVEPKDIPEDAITMNSLVKFTDETQKELKYWLVFPEDADISQGKISVLSPIGCALLGYKIGDAITLHTPQGRKDLTVKEVIHQPEREGKFDL